MAYPISDVTRRIIYSGSAGVGPYSFSFEILEQTDVAVYKNSTLLTLTTDYSVTINADGTGSVTLVSAASASDQITLFGDRAIERSTDFVTGGDLFANSLNEELDSQTIFAQQIDEKADRAIKAPITDPTTVDMTLPSKADRAEKILAFDIDGNPALTSEADIAAGISGAIVGANYVVTNATGNGSSVAFTVSSAPGSKSNIQIYIDGVYQNKNTFSISGTTVTFTEAPPSGAAVEFVVGYAIGVGGGAAEITYTPAGTGAVTTTVQAKLRETVSVKDFGAVGDGVTDDTAAIQAAIGVGTTVYFPQGNFRILSNVSMTTASLFAEGAVIVVPNGVTLTIGADIDAGEYKIFEVESGGSIVVSSSSTLGEIKGAWFDSTYTGESIIVRGQLAGHATVGGAGLSGLDYVHIDGYRACENTATGLEGLAIGTYAGSSATSLLYNTLVGYAAGRGKETSPGVFRSWTAQDVTVLGAGSLVNVLTGGGCTVVGSGAMKQFETGADVVAVGRFSGRLGTLQSNGVHLGSLAGYSVGTTGVAADNKEFVHIGFSSAINATQSYRNTLIGAFSGNGVTTGDENTAVGAYAGIESTTYGTKVKTIAIGSVARTRGSNTITIGNAITTVSDGELRIGGVGQTTAYVAGIYGSTTASAANVVVFSGDQLLRSTSSGQFKTDVELLEDQWAYKVLDLQPVYYRSLCTADNPSWGWYGLIAEDAAKVDPRFAQWGQKEKTNEDGSFVVDPDTGLVQLEDEYTPNGVAYERLVVPLINVVKRQQKMIENLEARVSALEGIK